MTLWLKEIHPHIIHSSVESSLSHSSDLEEKKNVWRHSVVSQFMHACLV